MNLQKEFPCQPFRMVNPIQHYSWGSKGDHALIPRLLKLSDKTKKPYAELWMGAHPKAPSQIIVGEEKFPLDAAIEVAPAFFLGEELVNQIGPHLPFLLKVLSSEEPLSIQVHPDKSTAKQLHQKDPVNYPDENHKPEIAYVLDELECLAGFRPMMEIFELIQAESELQAIFTDFHHWEGLSEASSFKRFWQFCLDRFESAPIEIDEQLRQLISRLANRNRIQDPNLALLPSLAKRYTQPDFGLLMSIFLQYRRLTAGQVLYLPPGGLHAYIRGNIIECMANSDNVVRAGLTHKYIDLLALKMVVNPLAQPQLLQPEKSRGHQIFTIPHSDFIFERLELGSAAVQEIKFRSIMLFFVWQGEIALKWRNGEENFRSGDSVILPVTLNSVRIEAQKPATIFMVRAGIF